MNQHALIVHLAATIICFRDKNVICVLIMITNDIAIKITVAFLNLFSEILIELSLKFKVMTLC